MRNPKLQAMLDQELGEGENLLWADQPTHNNIKEMALVLFCGAVVGAIGFGFLITNNLLLDHAPWQNWNWQTRLEFGISLAALAFVGLFSAILLYFVVRNHRLTIYAVTNKRLLTLIAGRRGLEVLSCWQNKLEGIRKHETSQDTGSFGVYYEGTWRRGFEHIRHAPQVEQLVLATFKLEPNLYEARHPEHHLEYH